MSRANRNSRGSGGDFVFVPIENLRHDPTNVRKHDARNLEAVKLSLERFGQQKPIVAKKDGTVIAGNATLAAARELGWLEMMVVFTKLDGDEAKAYAIADNRSAELAEWDWQQLSDQLAQLGESGFDTEILGIDDDELAAELEKLAEKAEEVTPEVADAVFEGVYEDMADDELPELGSAWMIGNSIVCVCHPVRELHIWRSLLTPEIEAVWPYPSAFLLASPQRDSRKLLLLQPIREAVAYMFRIARARGIEVSPLGMPIR